MKKTALAAILLVAGIGQALGAGYNFLNVGIDYLNQERFADAVEWLGKAIEAGDLVPDQLRIAHADRGDAFAQQNQPEKAISDYSAALAIAPGDTRTMVKRAFAYVAANQGDKAVADMVSLQQKRPNNLTFTFQHGLVDWSLQKYGDAANAFSAVNEKNSGAWFWLQLANLKLGKPPTPYTRARLSFTGGSRAYMSEVGWPDPIALFYTGSGSEEGVLEAAGASQHARCGANFYLAEWRLAHGDKTGAKPLMEKAARDCPVETVESRMARIAMKDLP